MRARATRLVREHLRAAQQPSTSLDFQSRDCSPRVQTLPSSSLSSQTLILRMSSSLCLSLHLGALTCYLCFSQEIGCLLPEIHFGGSRSHLP